MSKQTWAAIHRRGNVLRAVEAQANARRDGILPMTVPGVATTFADDLDLISALQLRWHTRLAGQVERALQERPADLESAVLLAWRRTEAEMPGVRRILDRYAESPTSDEMDTAMAIAREKEWALLAAMAGQAGPHDPGAAHAGQRLESRARGLVAARVGGEPAAPAVTP
jgi:hypothetical protein